MGTLSEYLGLVAGAARVVHMTRIGVKDLGTTPITKTDDTNIDSLHSLIPPVILVEGQHAMRS